MEEKYFLYIGIVSICYALHIQHQREKHWVKTNGIVSKVKTNNTVVNQTKSGIHIPEVI